MGVPLHSELQFKRHFSGRVRGAANYWVTRGWLLLHMTGSCENGDFNSIGLEGECLNSIEIGRVVLQWLWSSY